MLNGRKPEARPGPARARLFLEGPRPEPARARDSQARPITSFRSKYTEYLRKNSKYL